MPPKCKRYDFFLDGRATQFTSRNNSSDRFHFVQRVAIEAVLEVSKGDNVDLLFSISLRNYGDTLFTFVLAPLRRLHNINIFFFRFFFSLTLLLSLWCRLGLCFPPAAEYFSGYFSRKSTIPRRISNLINTPLCLRFCPTNLIRFFSNCRQNVTKSK